MFAFVLMPFDTKFDDIYKLGIQQTAARLGITAERVDEQIFHKENILERIYSQIAKADFIIADMTDRNPNVFYEVGYAHGRGKVCLLLTSNADDIPFDLRHHRHIIYGNSIQNLIQRLERDFGAIKSEVENRRSVIALHLVRSDGDLQTTRYYAHGSVELVFDLNNKTAGISPEIESVYFYTGAGWKFSQDAQECAQTDIDTASFEARHFVRAPVRRLPAGGWAQIKLVGKKQLDFSMEGKFQDRYRVYGKALIRVNTTDGSFDYPFNLDIEISDIPF